MSFFFFEHLVSEIFLVSADKCLLKNYLQDILVMQNNIDDTAVFKYVSALKILRFSLLHRLERLWA